MPMTKEREVALRDLPPKLQDRFKSLFDAISREYDKKVCVQTNPIMLGLNFKMSRRTISTLSIT
jgi:hypothetical protein